MKRKLATYVLMIAGLVMLASCNRDPEMVQLNFNATLEQVGSDDTKVQLARERWVLWEIGDQIDICSDKMDEKTYADLVNASGGTDFEDFNGVFIAALPDNSEAFLGLFPRNSGNTIASAGGKNFSALINLRQDQPLTNDTSFDHRVFPMVAWFGGEAYSVQENYQPANLDFHSLAGLVRIQIFSSVEKTLDEIVITSRNGRQLSGPFNVTGYKTFDPYLVPTAAGVAENQKIVIPCSGTTVGPNKLITFYLVLPAIASMNDSTNYPLTLDVKTTTEHCQRNFTARIRRNGINYMQALQVTGWAPLGNDSYTSSLGISGNGTASRPFKIYTEDDLVYLRDCYNDPARTINGQPITAETHIRIMRSGISVGQTKWASYGKEGITNFIGSIEYYGTNTSAPCIINNTNKPIFESIGATGHVTGITIKYDHSASGSGDEFAPLCRTNNGIIEDCHIVSGEADNGGIAYSGVGIAGICAINNNLVKGCGNTAVMASAGHGIGGIVHTNYGTVQGCYTASQMRVTSNSMVGGIVYSNTSTGTVKDCYFSTRVTTSSSSWGGIVYTNQGRVEHCYTGDYSSIITSSTAGGIVHTNSGGIINYCWSSATLRGNVVGSLASTLSSGTILNSFCHSDLLIITAGDNGSRYAGGLVGNMTGGWLVNCYAYLDHLQRLDNSGVLGGIVGHLTANNASAINNCYAYEIADPIAAFYGDNLNDAAVNETQCYLIGHSQTGVTSVAVGDIDDLVATLNANRASVSFSGGTAADSLRTWRFDGTVPTFVPYTQSN